MAADKQGKIYAGLGEPENQVQVFDKAGRSIRTIGKPGGRSLLGPWEPNGVRFMTALKIDSDGKLWVMENDTRPRRISVWDAQSGALQSELFGPTDYGAGGGAICPTDPYTMIGHGCEWKIDKETGRARCVAVVSRGQWRNARFGTGRDGRVYAAIGGGWAPAPAGEHLRAHRGRQVEAPRDHRHRRSRRRKAAAARQRLVRPQRRPAAAARRGPQIRPAAGRLDRRLVPVLQPSHDIRRNAVPHRRHGLDSVRVPEYDLWKAARLPVLDDAEGRGGMGAQEGLISEDKNFMLYNSHYGVEHSSLPCYDIRTGKLIFAYPSNYVGVHGGHLAPPPRTGLIRAAYDIVGTVKMPPPLDNLFFIGTDKGEWHILSSSGYYVSSLFEGDPMKIKWPDEATPGANMSTVPPGMGAEDFGGSVIRTTDGKVYVQAGKTAFTNCRVTGLDSVRPLGSGRLTDAPADVPDRPAVQGQVPPRVGVEERRRDQA